MSENTLAILLFIGTILLILFMYHQYDILDWLNKLGKDKKYEDDDDIIINL